MPAQRNTGRLRAILLPTKLDEALCAEARKKNRALSWVLREALITYLATCGYEVDGYGNPDSKGKRTDLYPSVGQSSDKYLATVRERLEEFGNAKYGKSTSFSEEDLKRLIDERIQLALEKKLSEEKPPESV